mgnify:CR=1 FL=1
MCIRDSDKEGHSYWDTTNKGGGGFLSQEERNKIDEDLKKSGKKTGSKVERQALDHIN